MFIKYILPLMFLFFFCWVVRADVETTTTRMVGVASSGGMDWPLLEKDLKSKETIEPAFFALGIALDATAQALGKFEEVPLYRVTHLMKTILHTFKESPEESPQVIVSRMYDLMTKDCRDSESEASCTFQIRVKSSDWIKPLPNLKAPASENDLNRYNEDYARRKFPEIRTRVEELAVNGRTVLFGNEIERENPETPMTKEEVLEAEKQFIQTYIEIVRANYFVKTKFGWFWIESADPRIRENMWGELTIRSKNAPRTYEELLQVVRQGLNKYYLRQKREEIFWAYLSMHNNDTIAMIEDLLGKSFFKWVGPNSENQLTWESIRTQMIDWITKLKKEKTDMVARFALLQNIMARMDGKDSLY